MIALALVVPVSSSSRAVRGARDVLRLDRVSDARREMTEVVRAHQHAEAPPAAPIPVCTGRSTKTAFMSTSPRGLFMVIDGVGGQAAGGKAADIALTMLRTRLERETGAGRRSSPGSDRDREQRDPPRSRDRGRSGTAWRAS